LLSGPIKAPRFPKKPCATGIDHHQSIADGLDDPRLKLIERGRVMNICRCNAMDPLSIWPALVPHGPDQRIEQDLAALIQDTDLDDFVDPRIKPRGLQIQEDCSHRSQMLTCADF
jgi:hypothetical protein